MCSDGLLALCFCFKGFNAWIFIFLIIFFFESSLFYEHV